MKNILFKFATLSIGGLLLASTFVVTDARFGAAQDSNQIFSQYVQVEELSSEELNNLDKMLTVLINDEYKARAEYQAINEAFGNQVPFSNLIKAETMHVSALTHLFEAYDLDTPSDNGSKYVVVPDTLEEAYSIGVDAEVDNIALYDKYLDQDLPSNVERVFTNLQNASENHLATFEAYENGRIPEDCYTFPMMRHQIKQFGRKQ